MTKRQDESKAKKLEKEINLGLAKTFIKKAGYKRIVDYKIWHHQLDNRMNFQKLIDNIGFEQSDIEDLCQEERLGITDIFLENIIKENNNDFWKRDKDIKNNFTPIRTATIKDISAINVLIGTSPKYKSIYKKVIDAANCLASNRDNTLPPEIMKEIESISFEDARKSITDTVLEKVHIVENRSTINESYSDDSVSHEIINELELLEEPIDDIIDTRLMNDDSNSSYIRVDLSCPTEQLKKQFAHWIRINKAEKMKLIKDNMELKINEWNNKKILEIWDLNMWCFINNVTLLIETKSAYYFQTLK